ncbi:hypothetical protein VTN00DRAFT_2823 [Thermoascus crustaceus]|uniref:uncharacterized protein n=1 Tax=Thermoascus crustaceus TaxID=5088 RepID=UPI0037440D02
MDTRMGPPPPPIDRSPDNLRANSEITLRNSSSLLGLQLPNMEPDPALEIRPSGPLLQSWLPFQNLSPRTSDDTFAPETAARFPHNDQEAWNPLHVTGVPPHSSVLDYPHHPAKHQRANEPDARFSYYPYGTPSEIGSQFNGFAPPSDSGYGSKSCATRSVVSSSFPLDSAPSPQHLPFNENHRFDITSIVDPVASNQPNDDAAAAAAAAVSGAAIGAVPSQFQVQYQDKTIKCDYRGCNWRGKCPSEKRKHEARHEKPFKCDEPNCHRNEGFGTINDLERHKRCVHKKKPERGHKMYICFGKNCPRRNKMWPRLDNFRQHINRMHAGEDVDELLNRSDVWYQRWKREQEKKTSVVDRFPSSPTRQEPQMQMATPNRSERNSNNDDAHQSASDLIAPSQIVKNPDIQSSAGFRLSPIKNFSSYGDRDTILAEAVSGKTVSQQTHAEQQSTTLPGLRALNLHSSFDQGPLEVDSLGPLSSPLQNSSSKGKSSDVVAEAAMNVVDAMTKMMTSSPRRQGSKGQTDRRNSIDRDEAALCNKRKEMIQMILSAALEQLGGGQTPGSAATHDKTCKTSGHETEPKEERVFKCDFCPKTTRLRCELKKHMKRHERPYGCTFPKCHKTFGSKADWKRHENSQHFHLQCWRCTQRDTTGLECARLFYRQEMYVQHLSKDHRIENRKDIDTFIRKNRIGRNGQSQFWCGFCKMIIPLKQQGLGAWNERFDHIDTVHFKNGERIGDWLPPGGHLTKEKERDEEKRKKAEEKRNNENAAASAANNNHNCENDTTSNSSDSSCGDDDEIGDSSLPATTAAAAATSSESQNRVRQETAREMSVELLDVRPQNATPVPASNTNSRKRKLPAEEAVTAQSYENTITLSKANTTAAAATTRDHGQSRTSNPAASGRRLNPTSRGGASPATSQRLADRERRETAALLFSTTEEPEKRNSVFCCQCMQGPWYPEIFAQCTVCSHTFCHCCVWECIPVEQE